MSRQDASRIHPTAVISSEVELGPNVEIGPHSVLEGKVVVGADCVIRPGAILCGNLTMGRGNIVYSGVVLGERPQHLRYRDEPTCLEIGENNVFRENVTIHRGTTASGTTRIGSHNFFMAGSHIGHDCVVGDRCIIANGALVGGHCILEDNVYLSGNCAVHQFVRIGRLALLSGVSGTSKDIPPFMIHQYIDSACGVNVVGMKRAGCNHEQINAVRKAFRILFRMGLVLPAALARLDQELGSVDVIQEILAFLRKTTKGINPYRHRSREDAA